MSKSPLTILLAQPRGFCAGVDRAIQIVEQALERYGRPIYVRHEIVHNRFVVENLERQGAVFVDELSEVPDDAKVIFSAHGVPKSVPVEAERRDLFYLDATCPLVSKAHNQAQHQQRTGRHLLLIGHEGHPEVIGTMGQLPDGSMTLVETVEDVATLDIPEETELAYVTQTTLSVDDTAAIVEALRAKFPNIAEPGSEDICYATTNRQEAVKAIAERCDAMIVIGAPNSSNSNRLVEVALRSGCQDAALVERASGMDWDRFDGYNTLGLTAGASAPETLVEEFVEACRTRYDVTIEEISVREENVHFNLPRALIA
ncbi:MAG: 4-hydroxy-3-methylbut-2-enyl diphosphate reductase [Rhodospirillaceae bacterium]|jgi:4-hydroxy-3-methylbut-2-enyl diphosphate reductase|nr:4-hydroxy-3-methylbut-2-enyl diphosphate reductase [Rhodospirillaceae bacterium]MBT5945287.1 4-hydroxy-3-methylbut-2-enyl diphosphate reductase [Rhodospirillaceae bacterium]MBT6405841.1 4-hydroxy-3-methylbut-2-enyl diphosphate reductase [Rhodospirillaceae bacterium]MBT6535041.1 4-hydroxy-3-methylbut-2-enyl diphosphate reductase [Rhodospirillaceae bacterium]MBT7363099.1 4-hydroxy-3-methylbut-2-enyl diphosphate reductase [Rhodospirillaceae bacterium]